MDRSRYDYTDLDGFIRVNTLSPNARFYYRILKPREINFGNYGTEIAFFEVKDRLIYHRKDVFAHWLPASDGIEFVEWTKDGNIAFFSEYSRDKVYDDICLDLSQRVSYRLDLRTLERINPQKSGPEARKAFVESIGSKTSEEIIVEFLEIGAKKSENYHDEFDSRNILQTVLLGPKIWHPTI